MTDLGLIVRCCCERTYLIHSFHRVGTYLTDAVHWVGAHRHVDWRILHLSKLDIKFGNLIWIANLRTVLPHIEFHILTIKVGIRRTFRDGSVERFTKKFRTDESWFHVGHAYAELCHFLRQCLADGFDGMFRGAVYARQRSEYAMSPTLCQWSVHHYAQTPACGGLSSYQTPFLSLYGNRRAHRHNSTSNSHPYYSYIILLSPL